jgi:hypothetical protein
MRVVWKDSKPKLHKPVKYRGHYIRGYNNGWTTDIPGDDNVYRTHYCALNAIDKALGGHGQMGSAKRKAYGIKIIGKKSDETA